MLKWIIQLAQCIDKGGCVAYKVPLKQAGSLCTTQKL